MKCGCSTGIPTKTKFNSMLKKPLKNRNTSICKEHDGDKFLN